MAISDNQKLDYLFKKIGYGATKTDLNANKLAANEAIPSPLLLRGDKVWAESGSVPAVKPTTDTAQVKLYTAVECVEDITSTGKRTWKTNITDWITPEFGSTYLVSVYIHDANDSAGAESLANKVFVTGSGNNDEWFFDYQSGVLNFIGDNLPDGKSFTGKSVYISGAVYQGRFGVGDATVTQGLQDQINTIISNTDPAALDSLSEIVTAFQSADSAFATSVDLSNIDASIRSDLALTVEEINDPVSNVSVANVTGIKFDVDGGFALTNNSDGTVTIRLESTFKTWHIFAEEGDATSTDIVASAVDEIDIRAGNNISITPVTTPGSKGITIASDISTELNNLEALLRNDLAFPSTNIEPAQTFTGDGTTTEYQLTASDLPSVEAIDVYVDDVLQRPDVFSISSDKKLVFNVVPDAGADIYVKYRFHFAIITAFPDNCIENRHLNLIYNSNQYAGDSTTTDYTIPNGHTVHSILVIVDGSILPPTDYSISGVTLTLNNAPATGAVVDFRFLPK